MHLLHSTSQLIIAAICLGHAVAALVTPSFFLTYLKTMGIGDGVGADGIILIGLLFAGLGAHNAHDAFAAKNHTGLICEVSFSCMSGPCP